MFERWAAGFDRLVPGDATIERVASGFYFTEGPLWDGDSLLFSDIPNSRIVRWRPTGAGPEVTTHRFPSNLANGLTFDAQRRLIACEGGSRRLTRAEPDGSITVLAETYQGKHVNSPNDVVVAADGSAYFSDPFWGVNFAYPASVGPEAERARNRTRELDWAGVFRVTPDGALGVVADDFVFPNGLAFAPDGKTLYVDDTRRFHIRAFDVRADGTLANGRVFCEMKQDKPGVPDGMKVDVEGNVYCTGPGGVWVVAPSGEPLGRIEPPEVPANCAWGDADWRTLYITARSGVYCVRLNVPGVPVP